jgi:hypothetical protein
VALPDGTYFATASVMLSQPNLSKEIPAGVVTLASPVGR